MKKEIHTRKPHTDEQGRAALEKLGERLRAGFAKQNPTQNFDAVREAIREQHAQKQALKQTQSIEPSKPTGQELPKPLDA